MLRCVIAGLLLIPAAAAAQTPAAGEQTPAPPPETKVDASRGGLTISSGVNSLTIGARMQFRWTLDDREDASADTAGAGVGRDDGPFSQFDVPRMRVSLSGGAFRPWLRYAFQFEFSRTGGEGGSRIKDAVIEVRPTGRHFRLAAGQFKAPFGLQQLTSSGRLQFVDRAITDAKFAPGRDMGVMVSGTTPGRRIGYDVGLFNGSGESVRQSTQAHLWAARVYAQPFGIYALSEGGSDAAPKPVLHAGAGVRSGRQIRGRTAAGVVEGADDQSALNLELALKWGRVYSTAEHFWMRDEQANPTAAGDIRSRGFHAQAGYMILPRRVEAALLYAHITADTDLRDAETTERRAAVNYYWQSHGLKLQVDAGQLGYGSRFADLAGRARQGLTAPGPRLSTGTALTDWQARLQMQIAF